MATLIQRPSPARPMAAPKSCTARQDVDIRRAGGRASGGPHSASLLKNRLGMSSLEYAVLFGLIVIPALGVLGSLGQNLASTFSSEPLSVTASTERARTAAEERLRPLSPEEVDRVRSPGDFDRDGDGSTSTDVSLLNRKLGTAGTAVVVVGSVAAGAAVGYVATAAAAALCAGSVVCGIVVAAGGVGYVAWDLYNGGWRNLVAAGRALLSGDATVGQAGTVGFSLSSLIGAGARVGTSLIKRAVASRGRAAAQGVANAAQGASPRPGAAGSLQVGNRTFAGTSTRGATPPTHHPRVQQALDNIPAAQRSRSHGRCVEPACISQALNEGVDPKGGVSTVLKVRAPGNSDHGADLPACPTCSKLLEVFGIRDGAR